MTSRRCDRRSSALTASASGATDDLLVGLQLTHSGRFSRPTTRGAAPRIAYRHPVLDARVGVRDDRAVFSDDELDRLVGDFLVAARHAQAAGFAFVDIKHCHGYLGHELLSGMTRPGSIRVARGAHSLPA